MCRHIDTIPACDGQTDRRLDGQTDGIAVASTSLAKRRAVKSDPYYVVFDTVIMKITWRNFFYSL